MNLHGRVLAVSLELAGDFLAVNVDVGTTALVLTDAADFSEFGGLGVLDPDDDYGGPFPFRYNSVDFDTGTLDLTSPTTAAIGEGAVARVAPEYEVIVAYVQPDDADIPPIMARVPYSMRAQLPVGQRSDVLGEGESLTLGIEEVIVELIRGSWMVTDILGVEPIIQGQTATDGRPPLYSPTPSVEGGIGSLYIRWEAIPDNPDPVKYEVHVSQDPAFVPDTSLDSLTRVGEIDGTYFVIENLPIPLGILPPPPPPSGTVDATMATRLPVLVSSATGLPPPPPTGGLTDGINTFNCGTALASVTIANSGGGNGDAFQVVNYGGGTIVYAVTSVLQSGKTCALTTGASSGAQYVGWTNPDGWTEVWARAYYLMTTPLNVAHELMRFSDGGSARFSIYRNVAGNLYVGVPGIGQMGVASSHAFAAGTGFRIEAHVIIGGVTSSVEAMLNWGTNLTSEAADEIWEPVTALAIGGSVDEIDFGRLNAQNDGEQTLIDGLAVSTADWQGPW